MFKLNFSEDCTVHDLAIQVKEGITLQIGSDEFTELLLFINKLIGGDAEHIFTVLANNTSDSLNYQMALCWLDSNGFGHTSFSEIQLGLHARRNLKQANTGLQSFQDSYIFPDFLN